MTIDAGPNGGVLRGRWPVACVAAGAQARARCRLERKLSGAGRDERTRLRFSRISIARCADLVRSSGARDHQIFTGKLTRKHLSFPDRAMASAIRAQESDFRNWADIRAWATGIADTLLA